MGKILAVAVIAALIYFLITPRFRVKKKDDATELLACDECGTYFSNDELALRDKKRLCKSCEAKLRGGK